MQTQIQLKTAMR